MTQTFSHSAPACRLPGSSPRPSPSTPSPPERTGSLFERRGSNMRYRFQPLTALAAVLALSVTVALGVGSSAASGLKAPEAGASIPKSVGKTEGKLNLIAWEGYAQSEWVKPFE